MPSAKTKHSQNDLGGQYKMSHKSLYFVNPSQIPSIVFCASVHGLFLLSYVTWNYCCDLAPFHQGCSWFSSILNTTFWSWIKISANERVPKLTVDRYRFCKIENAVEMLSDGYKSFCSKQVFSKSDISAQNASDVRWNIEKSITQKLTSQHGSRLVLPSVSGFSMDRRHASFGYPSFACVHSVWSPCHICSHSRPQSPSFLSHVVLRVWDFGHFGQESGMAFEGTTEVYERIYRFNSKWVRRV